MIMDIKRSWLTTYLPCIWASTSSWAPLEWSWCPRHQTRRSRLRTGLCRGASCCTACLYLAAGTTYLQYIDRPENVIIIISVKRLQCWTEASPKARQTVRSCAIQQSQIIYHDAKLHKLALIPLFLPLFHTHSQWRSQFACFKKRYFIFWLRKSTTQ